MFRPAGVATRRKLGVVGRSVSPSIFTPGPRFTGDTVTPAIISRKRILVTAQHTIGWIWNRIWLKKTPKGKNPKEEFHHLKLGHVMSAKPERYSENRNARDVARRENYPTSLFHKKIWTTEIVKPDCGKNPVRFQTCES
jgi:hypothetical protein